MTIYLMKDANENYLLGTTTNSILVEKARLDEKFERRLTLVDYHDTNNKFLETLLLIIWRRYHKSGEMIQLPLEQVVRFKTTCKKLEKVIG